MLIRTRHAAAGGSLLGGTVAAGTLSALLATRLLAPAPRLLEVQHVVERAVVAVGVLAGLWLTVWCLVGALCVWSRGLGRTWRSGERAVQRYAPAVVRRAIGVTVAATLAVGVASGAGAVAPAGDGLPPAGSAGVAASVSLDLGWGAVTTAPTDEAPTDDRPTAATDMVDDLGWVASPPSPPSVAPSPTAPSSGAAPTVSTSAAASTASTASTAKPTSERGHAGPRSGATPGTPGPHPAPDEPRRTDADVEATAPVTGPHPEAASHDVVVHPGDSLWSIAAAHLPADAAARSVAAAWPAWYDENVDLIGPDPGHIEPGQRLHEPSGSGTDRPTR